MEGRFRRPGASGCRVREQQRGRYNARRQASDAVTNMRMPIHHHVSYLLTFQITQK